MKGKKSKWIPEQVNTSLASNRGTLQKRAEMLAAVRSFFSHRHVLEVDTNILSKTAPIDAHIEIMKVDMGYGQTGYLHSSPEYELKKLLSKGSGDIYQLGHVFRAEEESPLHSPEFTMLEWYRVTMAYEDFIEETLDVIRLFLGDLPATISTYEEAFFEHAHINYQSDLTDHVLPFSKEAIHWDRDTQLNLLFTHLVEPKLQDLTVIKDYPSSQAALAKTAVIDGKNIARRFEVYFKGVELANGYDELTDGKEQKRRLVEENQKRLSLGKKELPIDEAFIACLDSMPECCGVAVGFDRLVMLCPTSAQLENGVQH